MLLSVITTSRKIELFGLEVSIDARRFHLYTDPSEQMSTQNNIFSRAECVRMSRATTRSQAVQVKRRAAKVGIALIFGLATVRLIYANSATDDDDWNFNSMCAGPYSTQECAVWFWGSAASGHQGQVNALQQEMYDNLQINSAYCALYPSWCANNEAQVEFYQEAANHAGEQLSYWSS